MGDKGKTSVNSCGPRNPEWETSVGDKCVRQVKHKCKLMWPKAPRVGDKTHVAQGNHSERQVWETSVGDKWKTSVNSCSPRHPE